jgi:hypothetical protein
VIELDLLPTPLAIVRLPGPAALPGWTAQARAFLSVTRTPEELSIVADASVVPAEAHIGAFYVAFRVRGPMPLELVGVLSTLAEPLARAGIPIFPIATHDTDYILVRHTDGDAASHAMSAAGIAVHRARG